VIYITELGEFKSFCQLLQNVVLLGGGAPKASLLLWYGGDGELEKSAGHAGGYWGGLDSFSLDF
jgi:hypothetical protein